MYETAPVDFKAFSLSNMCDVIKAFKLYTPALCLSLILTFRNK